MDHLDRVDLVLIKTEKKRTSFLFDFAVPADRRRKLKKDKNKQILGLCQRAKKEKKKKTAVERESDVDTKCNWCT